MPLRLARPLGALRATHGPGRRQKASPAHGRRHRATGHAGDAPRDRTARRFGDSAASAVAQEGPRPRGRRQHGRWSGCGDTRGRQGSPLGSASSAGTRWYCWPVCGVLSGPGPRCGRGGSEYLAEAGRPRCLAGRGI